MPEIKKLRVFLSEQWQLQAERKILWAPVALGLGIWVYFSLSQEPSIWIALILPVMALLPVMFLWRFDKNYLFFPILFFLVALGFATATIRAHVVQAPALYKETYPLTIEAEIEQMESLESGYRLVLRDIQIQRWKPEWSPEKLRLTVRTAVNDAKPGDRIKIKAILSPPPIPVYPKAYDFARSAYFQQIGGVGYSVSSVEIIKSANSYHFLTLISRLRRHITERIYDSMEAKTEAAVAAALITSERGSIPDEVNDQMRNSGLYHLLSISGLHMVLATASFFYLIRALLALIPAIALRYPIKKIAAFFALVSGFFYLLLAGQPVPAERAYIMILLFFMAIILDRLATPMRPVAWAALLILLLRPEELLNPSFQMSFAAVIALIAVFEEITTPKKGHTWFFRFFYYLLGITLSSVIASLATLPFSIFHFGQFSVYGILANLLAIPVTSFIVMPAGMFTLLLMPFGLEALPLIIMEKGISLILLISKTIGTLPYAGNNVIPMSTAAFGLMVIAMLCACLWAGKMRLLAIIPLIPALIVLSLPAKLPDILLSGEGDLFAVREDDTLQFSSLRQGRYTRNVWMEQFGRKNETPEKLSFFNRYDYGQASIQEKPLELMMPDITITEEDLSKKGTHAIWLSPLYIETVADKRGNRLWTRRTRASK